MNEIDLMQPDPDELPSMYSKLKRAIRKVSGMQLDSIEWNPNYVGLFVNVIYGGHEMRFLFSYNQLKAHDYRNQQLNNWIACELRRMADKQLYNRGGMTFVAFRQKRKRYLMLQDSKKVANE